MTIRSTAFKTTRAAAGRPLTNQHGQSAAIMLRAAALTDDPDLERLVQDIEDARTRHTASTGVAP